VPTIIDIDDHGLADRLALFSRKDIRNAQRRGVTEAVKLGRTLARNEAPDDTGFGKTQIAYRTNSRGTTAIGRDYIKNPGFYMRFQSRGVFTERFTQNGASRGTLPAYRFMQDAADILDGGTAKTIISQSVADALRKAGL
jgi:hypothetical protein